MSTFTNNEDPDEMAQNFSLNQCLHYLPRQNQYPGTKAHFNLLSLQAKVCARSTC